MMLGTVCCLHCLTGSIVGSHARDLGSNPACTIFLFFISLLGPRFGLFNNVKPVTFWFRFIFPFFYSEPFAGLNSPIVISVALTDNNVYLQIGRVLHASSWQTSLKYDQPAVKCNWLNIACDWGRVPRAPENSVVCCLTLLSVYCLGLVTAGAFVMIFINCASL